MEIDSALWAYTENGINTQEVIKGTAILNRISPNYIDAEISIAEHIPLHPRHQAPVKTIVPTYTLLNIKSAEYVSADT